MLDSEEMIKYPIVLKNSSPIEIKVQLSAFPNMYSRNTRKHVANEMPCLCVEKRLHTDKQKNLYLIFKHHFL